MIRKANFVVFCLFLLLLPACGTAVTRNDIESVTHLRLPSGAAGFQAYVDGWEDTVSRYRFTIPPAEMATFMASMKFDEAASTSHNGLTGTESDSGPDWWRPSTCAKFESGTMKFTNSAGQQGFQTVLVDTANPQIHTVYIYRYDP